MTCHRTVICVTTMLTLLTGCASPDTMLGPVDTIRYEHNEGKVITYSTTPSNSIKYACTKKDGNIVYDTMRYSLTTSHNDTHNSCKYIYISIGDINEVIALDGDNDMKHDIANTAITFTKHNCSTFLSALFANREGLTFWQKLINDFASAGSGAAAFSSPVASAALSGANVTFNHVMDAANATYYQMSQKTFETAVLKAMQTDENTIGKKLETPDNYPAVTLLSDLSAYSHNCTIEAGLNTISEAVSASTSTTGQIAK